MLFHPVVIVLALLVALPRVAPPAPSPAPPGATPAVPVSPRIEKLKIAGEEFKLEVAADEDARAQGLMKRAKLDADKGMIFIYPEPEELSFWMKNCVIDIDILYLDAKGTIVATHKMKAEPPQRANEHELDYEARLERYPSRRPAQFGIELKTGTIERLKLKPGQRIEMDVERLGKLAK